MAEDCYFFIDPNPEVPEEQRCMSVSCVECHDKHIPDTGWLYKGSTEGYGPFNYECCHCGKSIYKHDEEENEEEITR